MTIRAQLIERFLRYVAVESQSDAKGTTLPTRRASSAWPICWPGNCARSASPTSSSTTTPPSRR